MNEQTQSPTPTSAPRSLAVPILGACVVALALAFFYEGSQTSQLRGQLAAVQKDSAAFKSELVAANTELGKKLETMKSKFDEQQSEASADVDRIRSFAAHRADLVASKLERAQKEQAKAIVEQLNQVKESTEQAADRLTNMSEAVGSTRSDLDLAKADLSETRSDVSKAQSDLQRVRGDMGVMGGLLATNSKQIQELREMGDRNIYEFTIDKSAGRKKVGDIQVALRKADPKHNRFTLEVIADDRLVEKRDKNIDEPVQFYTSKAKQPYELVVNQVSKDRVTGYLATPKVTVSRTESGTTR